MLDYWLASPVVLGNIPVILVIKGINVIPVLIPDVFCDTEILINFLLIFLLWFVEIMTKVELVEKKGRLRMKKGTTSYVWRLKGGSRDSEQVMCRLSRNSVIARGGNTSNLLSV